MGKLTNGVRKVRPAFDCPNCTQSTMYSPSQNNSKAVRLADSSPQPANDNAQAHTSLGAHHVWNNTTGQTVHNSSGQNQNQTGANHAGDPSDEPKIVPVKSRKTISDIGPHNGIRPPQSVSTEFDTPYNRPAYESGEAVHYSRLASQYLQQGRIEDAERLYALALELAERTLPKDSPVIEHAIEDLAGFYIGREKWDRAEPLVARLLNQRSQVLPADDSLLIRTVDMLAGIYEKNGQFVQATALFKFLVLRQEESCGRNSIIVAFSLSRMAECYLRQEQYPSAEVLMLRILRIQETVYGRSSIEISTTLQELSNVFQKQGKFDRAAEMLERLVQILEDLHGPNGLAVASCLLRLADLLTEVNMFDQAEPLYRRAQTIYQRSYGSQTAAHSMFRAKLNRYSKTNTDLSALSKRSCDLPTEQLKSAAMPAFRLNNLDQTESGRQRVYPHIIDFEKPDPESTHKLNSKTIEFDTQEMTLVNTDNIPQDQQLLPLTAPAEPPLTPPLLMPSWPTNLAGGCDPAVSSAPVQTECEAPVQAASETDAAAEPEKAKTIWSVIDTVAFNRTVEKRD